MPCNGFRVRLTYALDNTGGGARPRVGVKVYEISQPAFDKAADPDWFPEDGEPWTVSKMYYVVWYLKRMVALNIAHESLQARTELKQVGVDVGEELRKLNAKLEAALGRT